MEMVTKWTVTEADGEYIFAKDEEIVNENVDRLAVKLSEFMQTEDADSYATYLLNTGVEMYNIELQADIMRKKKLSYRLHKFFKQLLRGVRG